jgi:nitroimidazol reductase NimA-like FMN-containing flavoprotein (pyridoxamine 5'-phosphate oxidase superfamily)
MESDDAMHPTAPDAHARIDGKIYVHGSKARRAMRVLARTEPACLTVTILNGLVLARSAFEHSANYESVVAFGHQNNRCDMTTARRSL